MRAVSENESSAPDSGAQADTIAGSDQRVEVAIQRPFRVGRFTIVDEIGRGGMGVVYTAYDPDLDRRIAVKLLQSEAPRKDGAGRARLLREAQALARLAHPNVVTVYEVGAFDDGVFLAMELVEGQTLKAWLAEETREWPAVVDMFVQAGRGLAAAHQAGLVHRDFKPSNVIIDESGRVRVLDFGIARIDMPADTDSFVGAEDSDPRAEASYSDQVALTAAGAAMGTPPYMAPEQHTAGLVDARSDQFSFCVALHEAVYGTRPFAGETLGDLRANIVGGRRRPVPEGRVVPSWLAAVIDRGLQRRADARFFDMNELLGELTRDRGRVRRVALFGAVLGLGALGASMLVRSPAAAATLCEQGAERLEDVWADEQRATVLERFGTDGSAHLVDALDDYAAQWVDTQAAVCRAAENEPRLDAPRQACLERRLSELRAHTLLLQTTPADALVGLTAAIESLREVKPCATIERFEADTPLPDDPERAARVVELRSRLDDAHAAFSVGRYEVIIAIATEVAESDVAAEYLPLRAEAQLLLGRALDEQGNYDTAVARFEDALWAAEVSRHDAAAVDIWLEMLSAVGYHQQRLEVAQAMVPRLDAALHRLGDDDRRRARAEKALGTLAYQGGEMEQAAMHFQRFLDAVEARVGPDDPRLSTPLQNLGTALLHVGKPAEAREMLERALALSRASRRPEGPALGAIHRTLGVIAATTKDWPTAERHYRKTLELFRRHYPESHPQLAPNLLNLAEVLYERGEEKDEALELTLEAERHAAKHKEFRKHNYKAARLLGWFYMDRGEPEQAREYLRRAGELADDPVLRAEYELELARALTLGKEQDPAEARTLAERARSTFAEHSDERLAKADAWLREHPDVASSGR